MTGIDIQELLLFKTSWLNETLEIIQCVRTRIMHSFEKIESWDEAANI